jgi:NAD(P)H-dependent FMN reductase
MLPEMNYFVLVGSDRERSQSAKVAAYISDLLYVRTGTAPHVLNLSQTILPPWDADRLRHDNAAASTWAPNRDALAAASGVVIVTPEWNGMVPPGVKNFFLWCSTNEVAHKPALIVAVSATFGGSYPVAELRMSSYKNNRICYIPEHVIVRRVRDVLNGEQPVSEDDARIRRRIQFALATLEAYANAMKDLRSDQRVFHEEFRYGM